MNSQVKLVSCTSLEDKAKEWFREICKVEKEDYDSFWIPINSFPIQAYESGYKQALKDMVERAEQWLKQKDKGGV